MGQIGSEPGWGAAYGYGPFLPRPARTFTQGAFGPFSPILPVPVDEPPPGGDLAGPRRFQYPVGYNLPTPPGLDGFKMASFSTLFTLANLYSVLRTCINRRKDMIAGLEWDIVPTREAAKAYQGSNSAMKDFGRRRAEAVRFFDRPDPDFDDWGSFQAALLEQVFVYDALSILIRPKYGKGLRRGVLGSDLDCVSLTDGATIRPLLSLAGGRPRPSAPGYQQYLFGVPRSDIANMWSGRDIADAGLKGYEGPVFSTDQLMYRLTTPRVNSPYGFSPVEMALIVIMTGLQKQAYQLNYYNEGTVPAVYLSVKDPTATPAQIRELQGALNGFAGDQAWHHKIIVTPDAAISPQRPAALADQFDEIIMASVAMVLDVDPMSLGIIPNVATSVSPFAAKEMAQASRTVHERTSTKPLLKFLCSITNSLLHRVMSQDDMKFVYSGMDEAQDQAAQTDMLVKQVQNGFISIDEAREELQRTAWGLDETSGPLVFTANGPVPLNQVVELMAASRPMDGGHGAAANSAGAVTASHQPRAVHHPPSSRPVGTHDPRAGLPSGTGLAPRPGGVSDTPAHAAARAHTAASKARAVAGELQALARHVRKGRDIGTWDPGHIPAAVLAGLRGDLAAGAAVDDAVGRAIAALGPAVVKAAAGTGSGPQAQGRAAQIAAQYTAQVQAAFAQVAAAAAPLIAAWLAGTLAVTAAGLAAMITALAAARLGEVLAALWKTAWHAGTVQGAEATGQRTGDGSAQAAAAWIASHGRDWLERIAATRQDDVAAGLDAAARSGLDADGIAARLGDWLDAAVRSPLIAVTETWHALNAGLAWAARKAGVVQKAWQTRGDAEVCKACKANQHQGWINFSEPFAGGTAEPGQHPNCRCRLRLRLRLRARRTGKAAGGARYVDLPGQQWWTPRDTSPQGPAPGGGGPVHAAHDGDDIQQYIPGGVPGMTAGGEPPRWPGGETGAVVSVSPGTVSAGRGDVQTRGGGTVGGPYLDFTGPEPAPPPQDGDDADDAAWPGERGPAPALGPSWPAQGYMGGYWPPAGHGTGQSPATSIGSGPRGRPPGPSGKSAAPPDGEPADPRAVYRQLLGNYPARSVSWVLDPSVRWHGPCEVPLDQVDIHDEDSWAAHHQPGAVERFARHIRAGTGHTDPVVMVRVAGQKARIIDGHHRYLACWRLGWPCRSYVGHVPAITLAMEETHSSQIHQGSSPANKAAGPGDPPVAAGLAVRAADTGRVLMLQRAVDADGDPASGFWEFAGGRLEDGESALDAARREWAEETGLRVPDGDLTGIWNSPGGRYRGFVLTVPSEDTLDILGDRDDTDNPDDPDGDHVEAIAWWDPAQLKDNPAVRPELAENHKRFRRALKGAVPDAVKDGKTSAEILREYWTREGHPGPTRYALEQKIRWGEPDDWYRCVDELTPYIGDGAKGYCNLRHKEVLGYWPAQHAQMEEGS